MRLFFALALQTLAFLSLFFHFAPQLKRVAFRVLRARSQRVVFAFQLRDLCQIVRRDLDRIEYSIVVRACAPLDASASCRFGVSHVRFLVRFACRFVCFRERKPRIEMRRQKHDIAPELLRQLPVLRLPRFFAFNGRNRFRRLRANGFAPPLFEVGARFLFALQVRFQARANQRLIQRFGRLLKAARDFIKQRRLLVLTQPMPQIARRNCHAKNAVKTASGQTSATVFLGVFGGLVHNRRDAIYRVFYFASRMFVNTKCETR